MWDDVGKPGSLEGIYTVVCFFFLDADSKHVRLLSISWRKHNPVVFAVITHFGEVTIYWKQKNMNRKDLFEKASSGSYFLGWATSITSKACPGHLVLSERSPVELLFALQTPRYLDPGSNIR